MFYNNFIIHFDKNSWYLIEIHIYLLRNNIWFMAVIHYPNIISINHKCRRF